MVLSDEDERTPLLASARRSNEASTLQEDSIIIKLGRAIGALRAGHLPSQNQLDAALQALLDADLLQVDPVSARRGSNKREGPLSAEGRRLVQSVRRLLEALQKFGRAKNGSNELQEIYFHAKQASFDFNYKLNAPDIVGSSLPSHRDVKQDTEAFIFSLRTLLELALSNTVGASQSLVADALFLLRNVIADSADEIGAQATATAAAIRPQEDNDDAIPNSGAVDAQVDELRDTLADTRQAAAEAAHIIGGIPNAIAQTSSQDASNTLNARFRKLVNRIRGNSEAIKATEVLLDLALKYIKTAEQVGGEARTAVEDTTVDMNVQDVQDHAALAKEALLSLIDNLSHQSPEQIGNTVQKVAYDIRSNDPLFEWAQDLDVYVRRLLTDTEYLQDEKSTEDASKLWQRFQDLQVVNPEWQKDSQNLIRQIELLAASLQTDSDLAEVISAAQELSGHFAMLSKQSIRVMLGDTRSIIWDLINIFLPRLLDILKQFPIPRVEMVTPEVDFVCDDFVLDQLSLLPSMLKVNTDSEFILTRDADIEAQNQPPAMFDGSSKLYMRGIKFACHDVSFWLRRKNAWFPCFRQETGFVDFSVLQKGLEATIAFRLNDPVQFGVLDAPRVDTAFDSFFTIDKVDVSLSSIDLHVRRSYHPFLYWLIRPFMKFGMRIGLRYILSSTIKTKLEEIDKIVFKLKGVVDTYQKQGCGLTEAWIKALASPAPQVISESVQGAYTQGQSLLEGARLTSRGIIKVDEGQDVALGIGAAQLLPGKGGPTHKGPHGNYGSGSLGRIQADVDTVTTEGAQDVKHKANVAAQGISNIVNDLDSLKKDRSLLQESALHEEAQEVSDTATWRSEAFDF